MLKRLWRRIVERRRRNIAELEQIEIELAKEKAHLQLLPPFSQRPYKVSTIVLFSVFGFFVAFAASQLNRPREPHRASSFRDRSGAHCSSFVLFSEAHALHRSICLEKHGAAVG